MLFAPLIFCGCNNKPVFEETDALQIINSELKYPRVVDYEIYRSDPAHAKKLLAAGLETSGMITVQKTQKLKDIGTPLITFTEAASHFLLRVSVKEKGLDIQKVKIAEEIVTDVKINASGEDKNLMIVNYTTAYKNITPFAVLMTRSLSEPVKHTATFILQGNKWALQKINN